jgi:hypothetical protein
MLKMGKAKNKGGFGYWSAHLGHLPHRQFTCQRVGHKAPLNCTLRGLWKLSSGQSPKQLSKTVNTSENLCLFTKSSSRCRAQRLLAKQLSFDAIAFGNELLKSFMQATCTIRLYISHYQTKLPVIDKWAVQRLSSVSWIWRIWLETFGIP